MKKILLLIAISILSSCSSQPAPAWQQDGNTTMTNFINSYMEGNDRFALNYYSKLVESLSLTADPDIMVIAPITKCAMNIALLKESSCPDIEPFSGTLKKKENLKYLNLVSGAKSDLPSKYRDLAKGTSPCSTEVTNLKIKKLDTPLSKIIGVSLAFHSGCYDEKTIMMAIDSASAEGWKRTALTYLDILLRYYEEKGLDEKAEAARKRIDLIR